MARSRCRRCATSRSRRRTSTTAARRRCASSVELYSRGGNVAPIQALDGTPIEGLGIPGLDADEISAIVAWLESLTDERVARRKALSDGPELFVPDGELGDDTRVFDFNGDGLAADRFIQIPPTGANGGAPLPGFLEGVFGP